MNFNVKIDFVLALCCDKLFLIRYARSVHLLPKKWTNSYDPTNSLECPILQQFKKILQGIKNPITIL